MFELLQVKEINAKASQLSPYEVKKTLLEGEINYAFIKNNEIHVILDFKRTIKSPPEKFYIGWGRSFWGLKLFVVSHCKDYENISTCI